MELCGTSVILALYLRASTSTLVDRPSFRRRAELFTKEKQRQDLARQGTPHKSRNIEVLLPDGSTRQGIAGVTTPLEIASGISNRMAKMSLLAQLNGDRFWDMSRPLEDSCKLEMLSYQENNDALQQAYWHSSAHMLGMALERKYGSRLLLCDGPAIKQGGFFYEFLLAKDSQDPKENPVPMALPDLLRDSFQGHEFSKEEFVDLEKLIQEQIRAQLPFERLKVTKEFAYDLYPENKFKQHFIANIPEGDDVTLYRCGTFVDLCRGPHVQHSGQIQALEILRTSSSYFMPELNRDPKSPQALTRMYAISFPSAKDIKKWRNDQKLAEQRNHRLIGKNQQLFAFHQASPGSVFMLPHGMRIANRLQAFIRQQYHKYGFDEVMTPLIYKKELWETSGHWQNYKDDMFQVMRGCDHHHHHGDDDDKPTHLQEGHDEVFGLKPMNCPGHCLMFDMLNRSYKDLPIRLADFSPLHRNEATGALSGLTRVRRFHQDDAHIFCRHDQIFEEIKSTLSFVDTVYRTFQFPSYELALSTRPLSGFLGTKEEWDGAEQSLKQALDQSGLPWTINEGDGAFYGPKIDILVRDALGRRHQTATVQLDFQLPQRFELKYFDQQGVKQSPVIVHRAVLGSVERMMAILIEHTGGRWPFWLSPRQAMVIPVFGSKKEGEQQQQPQQEGQEQNQESQHSSASNSVTDYARAVAKVLERGGECDSESERALVGLSPKSTTTSSSSSSLSSSSSTIDEAAQPEEQAPKDKAISLNEKHYYVDLDLSGQTLNKKVREAQVAQYNLILVIGEKEAERKTVNIRSRDGKQLGEYSIPKALELFRELEDEYQ
ncbi:54S ribosomal protein L39, mitochondrial [Actinomortierella ambigua]|uniref:threonine--tRNA ligase n=1 Tax=Actinomortierella ambigua TaxID=1343610 RepID=A0A9P6PXK0_9FUNG|nr:54S ribosomal protein L39, mitochondrial [Actinomortierella ambigua]